MTAPQRILVVNPLWPHSAHSVRAANVVVFELVAELARQAQLQVGFLKLSGADVAPTVVEEQGMRELMALGVEFLPPFVYSPESSPRPRLARWLAPDEADFYPEARHRPAATAAAMTFRPDLVFIPWSERATALFADLPVKKFAYYGNPDPKAGRARAAFAREHGGSYVAYARERLALSRLERVHLSIMRRFDYVGDVAANDAAYYSNRGHQNAFYIRNVWLDRVGTDWRVVRSNERTDPFVIVGNIGKFDGTANTHGLEILGRDILPELRRTFAGQQFEVHLFGAGQPHPAIARLLQAPEFRRRGFVEDIDRELMTAPVFLCANNASRFKVGHTRYLHAWSLGACIVAHADAAVSMPELISGRNCLLGNSSSQIAEHIVTVARDTQLRRKLGEAGFATFREKFTARAVVDQILSHVGYGSCATSSVFRKAVG